MESSTEKMRRWRQRNPGKAAELSRKWREEHPGYNKVRCRKYAQANKSKISEWRRRHPEIDRQYAASHPDKIREKSRRKRRLHPEITVMQDSVKRLLRSSNLSKSDRSREYIGCSPGFLRNWLERQFRDGMNWGNYGTLWVVDHIVPLSWWDLKNHPEHLWEASHYSNLQPLLISENAKKGDRYAYI